MYKGIQIISTKKIDKMAARVKARETEKREHLHQEGKREPVHVEKLADDKKSEGLAGRMTLGKAKSRSGFGGGA
jgi:hypothetical protein